MSITDKFLKEIKGSNSGMGKMNVQPVATEKGY